jgi:hypothetical protein
MAHRIFQSISNTTPRKLTVLSLSTVLFGGMLIAGQGGLASADVPWQGEETVLASTREEAAQTRRMVEYYRTKHFRKPRPGSPLEPLYFAVVGVQQSDPNDPDQVRQALNVVRAEVQTVRTTWRQWGRDDGDDEREDQQGSRGRHELEERTVFVIADRYETCMWRAERHYDRCIDSHPTATQPVCDADYAFTIMNLC